MAQSVNIGEFVAWVSCSQLTEVALVFCFCSPSASRFSVNRRNGLWGKSGGWGLKKTSPSGTNNLQLVTPNMSAHLDA